MPTKEELASFVHDVASTLGSAPSAREIERLRARAKALNEEHEYDVLMAKRGLVDGRHAED